MSTFAQLFQSKVQYNAPLVVVDFDTLSEYFEASCLAQEPLKAANVKKIAANIVKEGILKQPIKVVEITETGEVLIGGGRHRFAAAQQVCDTYCLNASGKLVKQGENGVPDECDAIEPEMGVMWLTVANNADAVSILTSDNESRSKTAAEEAMMKEWGGLLTQSAKIKLALKRIIEGTRVMLLNEAGTAFSLVITSETANKIATSLLGKNGVGSAKAKYLTTSQIEALGNAFCEFVTEEANSEAWNSNFARDGHKQALEDFYSVEATDEYGEVITALDSDGDEYELSWIKHFANSIVTPAKSKKANKETEANATIEALRAKLLSLGLNPDEV